MAKEAISEVAIPLPYALNLIYDTTRWYHKRVHEIGWYLKGGPNLGPPFDGTICGYTLLE